MEHTHSQILLYTKGGKRVSIIQSFPYDEENHVSYRAAFGCCSGLYGRTVEVMIDDEQPQPHLGFEKLVQLLQSL
jgi:hypothetical protein